MLSGRGPGEDCGSSFQEKVMGCKMFHGLWLEICITHCTVNTGLLYTGDPVLASCLTVAESSEPSMTDHALASITSNRDKLQPQSEKRVN